MSNRLQYHVASGSRKLLTSARCPCSAAKQLTRKAIEDQLANELGHYINVDCGGLSWRFQTAGVLLKCGEGSGKGDSQ